MENKQTTLENLLVHELFINFLNELNKKDLEHPELDRSPAIIGLTAGIDIVAYFFAELQLMQELDESELLTVIKQDFTNRKEYWTNLIQKHLENN